MLSALFYTQIGYYWQFLILQMKAREEAHEAWLGSLPDAQLFRISPEDVTTSGRWTEAGKECWFKDHLYDVVRQKKIGGKTIFFCMDDERETQLVERSGEMTKAAQDHPGKKGPPSFPGKMGDVLLSQGSNHVRLPLVTERKDSYFSENKYQDHFQEITPRPPWS